MANNRLPKISLNRRFEPSRTARQPKLKSPRWYAGFTCRGRKPQALVELISQTVHKFGLSQQVPLIRLEKKAEGEFYFFVAIESDRPGQFPNDIQKNLLPLLDLNGCRAVKGRSHFPYADIKTMVGPAHDVLDYTNPIPYPDPGEQSPIENPFSGNWQEFGSQQHNPNLLKLLDWLSAKGNGTWLGFQKTCQILNLAEPGRVLRHLKLLGHLETSKNGKKWAIAPTALVPLSPHPENREFYLCGQQTAFVRRELQKFSQITEQPQAVNYAPPRVCVQFFERVGDRHLEAIGGIAIHKPGNIAQQLAERLPTLAQWQAMLQSVGGLVASQYQWKRYDGETFQDCGIPRRSGFYEMRRDAECESPERTLFYEADTDTWRQGDWYALRFLAIHHEQHLQDCYYDRECSQLAIPYSQRWPQLYERALVLASGRLPNFRKVEEQPWLVYENITPELAYWLTETLTLHCRGLD